MAMEDTTEEGPLKTTLDRIHGGQRGRKTYGSAKDTSPNKDSSAPVMHPTSDDEEGTAVLSACNDDESCGKGTSSLFQQDDDGFLDEEQGNSQGLVSDEVENEPEKELSHRQEKSLVLDKNLPAEEEESLVVDFSQVESTESQHAPDVSDAEPDNVEVDQEPPEQELVHDGSQVADAGEIEREMKKLEDSQSQEIDTSSSQAVQSDDLVNDASQTDPSAGKEQPDDQELKSSTDSLVEHADMETVTVKDIVESLEVEYGVKLTKSTRKMLRTYLAEKVKSQEQQQPEAVPDDVVDTENQDGKDEEMDEDESVDDANEELSDDGSEYEEEKSKIMKKRSTKKKKKAEKPPKKVHATRERKKRPPSHMRIHAEMLRKRRAEELRVRNEELGAAAEEKVSEEDRKRAQLIAAKFETDTDELRLQRLEGRLDLLQKLDKKRFVLISGDGDGNAKESASNSDKQKPSPDGEVAKKGQVSLPKLGKFEGETIAPGDSDDSESEEEDELQFIDPSKKSDVPNTPSVVNFVSKGQNCAQTLRAAKTKSKALSILETADKKKDSKNTAEACKLSPKKIMADPRMLLRKSLKAKQMKAGNMWLARELGYKTEEEHIRDCQLVEEQKRQQVLKREEERLKANDRRHLRERLMLEGENVDDGEAEFNPEDTVDANTNVDEVAGVSLPREEEDEEIALAREIAETQTDNNDKKKEIEPNDSIRPDLAVVNGSVEEKTTASGNSASLKNASPDSMSELVRNVETHTNVGKDHASMLKSRGCSETKHLSLNVELLEDKPGHVTSDKTHTGEVENNEHFLVPTSESQVLIDDNVDETQPESANDKEEASVALSDSQTMVDDSEDAAPLESSGPSVEETAEPIHDQEDNSERPLQDACSDEENEFSEKDDSVETAETTKPVVERKEKNSAWKTLLAKEAETIKKLKKKGGKALVETEADEEEEEEAVVGLEDFGFGIKKKAKGDDDDEEGVDKVEEDDLEHVVDDLSDNEGDEEAGDEARKLLESKEERERHKEIMRRMRDGYDGRRGGVAGGGARGVHRFDQLVAADNRDDAKRLGLLNDDEIDSDNEDDANKDGKDNPEDDDEALLLDKMLKDRFLHRSSVDSALEENFSEDEEEQDDPDGADEEANEVDHEELEQERLAKRFAKRARMQRLLEIHDGDEEFSQSRLIDEDESLKQDLKKMKNALSRDYKRQYSLNSSLGLSLSGDSRSQAESKRQKSDGSSGSTKKFLLHNGSSSLSLALRASRKRKSTFLSGGAEQSCVTSNNKTVSLSHVLFNTEPSSSSRSTPFSSSVGAKKSVFGPKKQRSEGNGSQRLWSKVTANGFSRRSA